MVNSGKVSCTRRRKAVKECIARAEYIAQHFKDPPQNKRGRPKRTRGFQKKTKQKVASSSPSVVTPPRCLTQQRRTRSNSRPASTRKKSPPSQYTAEPAPRTKVRSYISEWHKKKEALQNNLKILKESNTSYRQMLYSSYAEIEKMNSELLRPGFEERVDGPITDDFLDDLSHEEMSSFLKKFLGSSDPRDSQIRSILADIGLACTGRRSRKASVESCVKGWARLLDYHLGNYSPRDRANIVGEMVFNSKLLSADERNHAACEVAKSVTSSIFSSIALLRSMDISGGSLNDRAIHQYARLEKEQGLSHAKRGQSLLHHRSKLTHARNIANHCAKKVFDIDHDKDCVAGDRVTINPNNLLRIACDAHLLTEKAVAGKLQLGIAGDAAQLTSTTNADQTTIGFKILDEDAVSPLQPNVKLFLETVEDEDGEVRQCYRNCQSTDYCLPCVMVEAKEGEAVHHGCADDFFDFVRTLEQEGLPAEGRHPAFRQVDIVGCGDMSFQQKMIGAGGACKVKRLFCNYCACDGKYDLFSVRTGDERCDICLFNNTNSCSHMSVCDKDEMVRKEDNLCAMLLEDFKERSGAPQATVVDMVPDGETLCFSGQFDDEGSQIMTPVNLREAISPDGEFLRAHTYDYLREIIHVEEEEHVSSNTCIRLDVMQYQRDSCVDNIDFVVGNDEQRDNEFHFNVLKDLLLRFDRAKIPRDKCERIELLRQCLHKSQEIRMGRTAFKQYEMALKTRRLDPGQCPPCVLHAHCRIVEKIVQQLLLAAMRKVTSNDDLDNLVTLVETTVNDNMLKRVTVSKSKGWRFPLTNDRKLDDINLSNNRARSFAKNFHFLVEVCTERYEVSYKLTWMDICERFVSVFQFVDSKIRFEFEDVCAFQMEADKFCEVYTSVTGRDGMTNYVHCLRAGHFSYFLRKYKNLYRLSQQGWENVNSQLKATFLRSTQRGGGKGGSSKLLPVMYKLARGVLWRYGHLDGLFDHLGYKRTLDVEYGKIAQMPRVQDVSLEDIEHFSRMVIDLPESTGDQLTIINEEDTFDEAMI